jgi:hypothetical protein
MAANDAAMSTNVDFEDDGIFGARKLVQRLTALGTAALLGGQDVIFRDGWEMGIIASFGSGAIGLLAARSRWRRIGLGGIRGRGSGGCGGLGLAAEELLFAKPEQGLESVDLGLQLGLTFEGATMHGPPVGGLPPGLELLVEARANRTGALRQGQGGTDGNDRYSGYGRTGARPAQFRDRDPEGGEAEYGSRPVVHAGRI